MSRKTQQRTANSIFSKFGQAEPAHTTFYQATTSSLQSIQNTNNPSTTSYSLASGMAQHITNMHQSGEMMTRCHKKPKTSNNQAAFQDYDRIFYG